MSALVQTIVNQWNAHYNARQFQAQVQQHAGMLFATCRRMLRNTADAEDVTQECLEIFARSGMYTQGFAGPWLHGVAVNRCLQKLRSERRLRNHELQFAATLPAWVETKCDDLTPQVDAIVAELHDDLRIPLVAHFFEGKSHAAIARKLGIPRRTISHRIERAVDEVRDGLRRRGIPIAGLLLFMQARTADAAAALLELPEHLRMIKVPSIQLDPRFATAFRWGRMAVATAMIVAVAATVASVVTQAPTQAMHATEPVVAIAAQSERVTSLEPTTPVELVNDFVQSGMWLGMDSNAVSDDTSNSPRGIRLVSDPGRFNYDANQASGLGGLTGHTRAGRTGWNDSTPRAFAVASPPPRRLSQSNTRTSGSFENISELFGSLVKRLPPDFVTMFM